MSKFPVSPYWNANPTIPIFLDSSHEREPSPPPHDADEQICATCATSSRDQPLHCISVSPAPPSYTSIEEEPFPSPPIPSPPIPSSNHLSVETTPPHWSKPQPPLPALRFDPEGRPHIRFRRNAFSPLSPPTMRGDDIDWNSKSSLGLAIPDAPFKPDVSPSTEERVAGDGSEALPGASNFAQRVEQKLWKYSASKSVMKRWLLEIISWSLSAACMTGIMVTLFVYKNGPIPKWPLGITLNAYISVLAKIASAGLLLPVSEALGQLKWSWFNKKNTQKMWDFEIFDNASRGPWGSLLLLVRTKGKSLAALGAAVTIFALALDPFFQQVVEYPERWRLQPGNGTIPRALKYKPYGAGLQYRRDSGGMLEPDPKFLGILDQFFYDNGTAPISFGRSERAEVPLWCPSRNCTWPQYETLGVCSKCANVSDLIEFKCTNKEMDWVQVPDSNSTTEENLYPNGTACGWWLKTDNPLLMTGYNIDQDTEHSGEILLMRAQPLYDIFTREPLPGYPAKLNTTRNPLAHAVIVSGGGLERIQRNETPIAHECIISWCVQEMLSEYSEGGYTEIIKNAIINTTMGPNPWLTEEVVDDEGMPVGVSYTYIENVTLVSPSGHSYLIDNTTHSVTLALFDEAFPSTYTLVNSTDEADAMLRYKQYVTMDPWTRNVTYNPFMFPNVSEHIEHMATALTNSMRSSDDNTEKIDGPCFDRDTIVEVRWAWLSLPLGLLGLTFVFLMATIIRSSMEQEHIGVYKTSAIATLLFGLPDDMQKKIKASGAQGTPRAKARETKVKWVPNRGWRFSGNTILSDLSPVEKDGASQCIPDAHAPGRTGRPL